jgi:hypothetical protein
MAEHYLQIDDQNWLIIPWPLILIKSHFNYFNLCLQENVHITLKLYEERKFICCKVILFKNSIKTLKFEYFTRARTNAYKKVNIN